jgi:predicted DCC family thiol-disulfide oxidoreductase YuxK
LASANDLVNPEFSATVADAAPGWVLYDGDCPLCTGAAARFAPLLRRHRFRLAPLQTDWVRRRLALPPDAPLAEMKLLAADGSVYGGAEALVQIARRIWWAWPLFALAHIPGAMILLRAGYGRLASNRHCFGRACQLPRPDRFGDYVPLLLLPALALLTQHLVAAWVFMWLLALAVYFGCKWLTWRRALRCTGGVPRRRSFAYLFAWVGMDARSFLRDRCHLAAPRPRDWLLAAGKIMLGAILIWLVACRFMGAEPLAAGWIGMVGVILCLHFGLFHLLALAWRQAGVDAQPLMREPWRAVSLAEFWGRRWNTGFHALVNEFAFRPCARRCGVPAATLLVFLLSGLIHDLIISLPARGGYGLPTAYFMFQGLGVLLERTAIAQSLGLGRGGPGRLFSVLWTAGPAFWPFHPVFIRHVILPMLHALGAT